MTHKVLRIAHSFQQNSTKWSALTYLVDRLKGFIKLCLITRFMIQNFKFYHITSKELIFRLLPHVRLKSFLVLLVLKIKFINGEHWLSRIILHLSSSFTYVSTFTVCFPPISIVWFSWQSFHTLSLHSICCSSDTVFLFLSY